MGKAGPRLVVALGQHAFRASPHLALNLQSPPVRALEKKAIAAQAFYFAVIITFLKNGHKKAPREMPY